MLIIHISDWLQGDTLKPSVISICIKADVKMINTEYFC